MKFVSSDIFAIFIYVIIVERQQLFSFSLPLWVVTSIGYRRKSLVLAVKMLLVQSTALDLKKGGRLPCDVRRPGFTSCHFSSRRGDRAAGVRQTLAPSGLNRFGRCAASCALQTPRTDSRRAPSLAPLPINRYTFPIGRSLATRLHLPAAVRPSKATSGSDWL